MATEFTYNISTDFPGGQVNTRTLQNEITASSITATVIKIDTVGDQLTIHFNTDLSAGEETTLDGDISSPAGGLIAAHDAAAVDGSILLSGTDAVSTTSTSFVTIPGLLATPNAGTYTVTLSGSMENDSRSKKVEVAIFIDGSQINHSSRRFHRGNQQQVAPFVSVTRATLSGSQTVEGRWKVDSGSSGTITERSLLILPA